MPFHLSYPFPRLWSIDAGVAMVVSDLHGDWHRYTRYRDHFLTLLAAGQADCLIFTGDLIHREPGKGEDRSLEMVLDVLALRKQYGERIIYLCGNHELPHLYGFVLSKGTNEYTPSFEAALSESRRRKEVCALFASLPFFVRTAAGVVLTHAGASPPLADPTQAVTLFNWSHAAVHEWVDTHLAAADLQELRSGYARLSAEASYEAMARRYLAVDGPDDSRFDDLLRGFLATAHPDFRLLRAALFARCEQEHGEAYAELLHASFHNLSQDSTPQSVLVAGHMRTSGGHGVVAQRHLRIASGAHARPLKDGEYLLFDTAHLLGSLSELLQGLHHMP